MEEYSAPSYAFTVNAFSVPLAYRAFVHRSFSPVASVVVPAVAAVQAVPFHFSSVPVEIASTRNESVSPSTSA